MDCRDGSRIEAAAIAHVLHHHIQQNFEIKIYDDEAEIKAKLANQATLRYWKDELNWELMLKLGGEHPEASLVGEQFDKLRKIMKKEGVKVTQGIKKAYMIKAINSARQSKRLTSSELGDK